MFASQEQLQKIGRENMEAAIAVAQAQLGAFEKLASLNLELTKASFSAWSQGMRALAGAGNFQQELHLPDASSVIQKAKKAV